eukprot:COSAG05_NODE_1290_length_5264_cov_2884.921394_4_plen_300_part_00
MRLTVEVTESPQDHAALSPSQPRRIVHSVVNWTLGSQNVCSACAHRAKRVTARQAAADGSWLCVHLHGQEEKSVCLLEVKLGRGSQHCQPDDRSYIFRTDAAVPSSGDNSSQRASSVVTGTGPGDAELKFIFESAPGCAEFAAAFARVVYPQHKSSCQDEKVAKRQTDEAGQTSSASVLRDNNSAADLVSAAAISTDYYFHYYGQLMFQQNMLQDFVRTSHYRRAVLENQLDFHGKVVVDVGCGSGILSFFAAQAGARRVYGIEASRAAVDAEMLVRVCAASCRCFQITQTARVCRQME